MNVVDQHQMPARRARLGTRRQRKGAGDDALALLASLAAERCGRLDAEQQMMVARRAISRAISRACPVRRPYLSRSATVRATGP